MDKLREAIRQRQIASGSFYFMCLYPEFDSRNLPFLIAEVERQGFDLGTGADWEQVYEALRDRLAVQKGEANGGK